MIKPVKTIEQALNQIAQCRAIMKAVKYNDTQDSQTAKRQHVANLERAFMVYNTLKIKLEQEQQYNAKAS